MISLIGHSECLTEEALLGHGADVFPELHKRLIPASD